MAEGLKKAFLKSNRISEKDRIIIGKELENKDYCPCDALLAEIDSIESTSGYFGANDIYYKYNLNKPIYVSDKKVYLIFDSLIMQRGRSIDSEFGVSGGGCLMWVFEKKNGSWSLAEKLVLEMY